MPSTKIKRGPVKPTVSVLMSVYNAGKFLKPAIDSLIQQTFTDFELIIIENGSNDGSRNVVRSYDDPRIKIFEFKKNIGRTPALNEAINKASGTYIAIQDADDISMSQRLELQVNYMNAIPDNVLLGTYCCFINKQDQIIGEFRPPIKSEEVYQKLAYQNVIFHSSAMYRRANCEAVGGYPNDLVFAQDYGLWIRLAKTGKIANLPYRLVSIRDHEARLTNSPASSLNQSLDSITCFKRARKLPNLEAKTIRLNRCVEALEKGKVAKIYAQDGKWGTALGWSLRAVFRDPVSVIKKIFCKKSNFY